MRLGIIGLPQAGKTTIFNALTKGDKSLTTNGGGFEVHTSAVNVPDHRVDLLTDLFKPKKITYAKVAYVDIAGLDGRANGSIAGSLLNQLTQMDGFLHVVRCFEDPTVAHPSGNVDPQLDLDLIDAEMLLNDLIIVERKLERLAEERRKGKGRDKAQLAREEDLFTLLRAALSEETPLRDMDWTLEVEKALSGYGFLTRKPVLIVLNVGEDQDPPMIDYPHKRSGVIDLTGRLEMEIAQLPVEEASAFLQEFGISEPGLERVIRLSYGLLGLISFFTVGPDEVRAWTVRGGSTTLDSAAVIHSDLQKGFIRGEVIDWQNLISLGGLSEARAKGKLRLEGKDYQVKDGEIMHVRFNV